MVEREKSGRLVAQNYSKVFRDHLEPASQLMNKAAELTDNESLRKFLRSRSNAFLSDDYYQSDKDWMDLDSKIEVTIGPYEVYEDTLAAQKAAFESFVTITDPVESEKLSLYKSLLPEMEQNLPIPDEMKSNRGSESPIRVVDLVFSSGESRKSVQTIAFNLPNDERVRKEKGAKKVMLRNLIAAKFKKLETSVRNLVRDICTWQHNGDKSVVDAVFDKYGELDDTTQSALGRLTKVAVDIKPCYPLAGEDCQEALSF